MDAKALGAIYRRMVASSRLEPEDAEFGVWKEVLGGFSESDLDAACRRWKADTEVEERTGKPRGNRLPSASELKLSIQLFNRGRNYRRSELPSREETEREQATPEWEAANKKLRETLARIAGKTNMNQSGASK
jgi:hypothetical protein